MKVFLKLIYFIVDIVENLLMSSPNILCFFLKHSPPGLYDYLGKVKSLVAFYKASERVPAYKDFLAKNNIDSKLVKSYNDFVKIVPETNKENYVYKYSITNRCVDGELPYSGNIDESAGSSGKATMWVRSTNEEKKIGKLVSFALQYTFKAFTKNNLIILNCWSTGPWATGIKFSQLAQKSSVVKCISTNKENAIETIMTFGSKYEYLICGYPPFVKEILDYGDKVGLDWDKYNINVVTGGEGFSEGWRQYVRKKIKGSQGEIYSAYGASDIDIHIGWETDLTIKIKEISDKDSEFRKHIYGTDQIPTFLGIYNSLLYNLENTPSQNIVFTALNTRLCSPKIRYNLKDAGIVFSYKKLKKLVTTYKKEYSKYFGNTLKLPFIAIFGRSDGTISLDGANIYPNDVQDALYKSDYAKYINSFFINVGYLEDKSMFFEISIELIEEKDIDDIEKDVSLKLSEHVRDILIKANKDYKESYENNPESLLPRIKWYNYNSGKFVENRSRIKNVYYINNKG